jgi:hypothetical protein
LYGKARQAYKSASRAARNRGGEVASELGMDDKNSGSAMDMGQADVEHAEALVYLQRVRGLRDQISLAETALAAHVAGVDKAQVDAMKKDLAATWDASLKAVDASIDLLDGASNKMKRQNYGWVSQASLAAALQLKSLLASREDAAAALDEAIAQYTAAIEGRQDSPFLKPYVRVLDQVKAVQAEGVVGGGASSQPSESDDVADRKTSKPARSPAAKTRGKAKEEPEKEPAAKKPAPKRERTPAKPKRTPAKTRG